MQARGSLDGNRATAFGGFGLIEERLDHDLNERLMFCNRAGGIIRDPKVCSIESDGLS